MNGRHTVFALGILFVALSCLSPQLVLAGLYADSAHGQKVDRSSIDNRFSDPPYAVGNCAHCHEQHASLGGVEPDPQGGLPSKYLLFASMTSHAFCNECHDSDGPAEDDVAILSSHASGHKNPSPITGMIVRCVDCHDVHIAQSVKHIEADDGNTASAVLRKVGGVDVTNWTDIGKPASLPGENLMTTVNYTEIKPEDGDEITKEYQLCLKCHSSYAYTDAQLAGFGWSDQAKDFNHWNVSFHPVTGRLNQQWNNTFIRTNPGDAMVAGSGWDELSNVNKRMYCSDCHSDPLDTSRVTPGPKGPHGSNATYLLRGVGSGGTVNDLCLLCHNFNPTGSQAGKAHTGSPKHITFALGCLGCHGGYLSTNSESRRGSIHGTNYWWSDPAPDGSPARAFLVGGYLGSVDTINQTCKGPGCGKHNNTPASWP